MSIATWRCAPGIAASADWLQSVEAAVAEGEAGFAQFSREPSRGAWWGRLIAGADDLFVKARCISAPRQRLASMLLPRGLRREWRQSLWYQLLGQPMAEPLALGEYRSIRMLHTSVFVARWVDGGRPLADVAQATAEGDLRLRLIESAGLLFGSLFSHGVIHKQYHPWNVLVRYAADNGDPVLLPIDLQHLWISKRLVDEDFCWALQQVSFWLHDPVIQWQRADEAGAFYQAALAAAWPALDAPGQVEAFIEWLLPRGREAGKLRRERWSPPGR